MKRYNWPLGLFTSLGIALLSALSKVLPLARVTGWVFIAVIFLVFLYVFLFLLFCWAAHNYLADKKLFHRMKNRFLIAFTSILAVGAFGFLYEQFYAAVITSSRLTAMPAARRWVLILVHCTTFSGIYYCIVFYIRKQRKNQEDRLLLEHLKQAQLQARLASLKEQLSPHFLFNALNTLNSLTQDTAVKDYVNELANVYRYVLQHKENDFVTVRQELRFITSYLYIVRSRFEAAIACSIRIDDDVLHSRIPPLALQMLVENAIKHNVTAVYKPLNIFIYNDNCRYLVVENTCQPRTSVQWTEGIGLENIAQRFQLLGNREIVIERSAQLFTVKLPLDGRIDL